MKTKFTTLFTCLIIYLFCGCEGHQKFYRPNLPEKLSVLAEIDADDTLRYISIEKSFQLEYPEERFDSLRGLSFTISSMESNLLSFSSDTALRNLQAMKIPSSISFNENEKYYLDAKVDSMSAIFSEISVPGPPHGLSLLSVNGESTAPLPLPVCIGVYGKPRLIVLDLTFDVDENQNYYAVYICGEGLKGFDSGGTDNIPLEFQVRKCNAQGFFAGMQGLNTYKWSFNCDKKNFIRKNIPVSAYYIDANKISGNKCLIEISTRISDLESTFDIAEKIRIKLLSIPKALYLYKKSLYTYQKTKDDPFTEPVNFEGNIQGGIGVFAVYRSIDLTFDLPPTIYSW